MMNTENRETFLSFAELFSRSARHCHEAEEFLRGTLPQVDEPYRQALQLIAEKERRLARELEKYAEQGPKNLIRTHLQYHLEQEQPAHPDTPGGAVEGVTRVNGELARLLNDLAEKTSAESLIGMIGSLQQEVDAITRQISMIRLTVRDV